LNILVVNTSASRGGASSVAKIIHKGVNHYGYANSIFISGRNHDDSDSRIVDLGVSQLRFLLNVFLYRLTSVEGVMNRRLWDQVLVKYYSWADVIHLHNTHGYYLPNCVLELLLKKPVVWTLHDYWLGTGRCASPGKCRGFESGCFSCSHLYLYPSSLVDSASEGKRYRESLFFNSSAQFVVPSNISRDLFVKMGIPESRLSVIPNPLCDVPKDITSFSQKNIRKELGIPLDRRVVVFVANRVDDPGKGFAVLLEALSRLPRQEWFLVVVGQISRKVKREVRLSHLDVLYTGIIKDRHLFFQYLLASDCLVNPSFSETFGLVNVEALAVGRPVVCSDLPVFREVKHEMIHFYEPGDTSGLVHILRDLFRGEIRCDGMKPFDGNTISHFFSEEKAVSRYVDLYRRVLRESELKRVTEERDILKKATAYFAKESR